MFGALKPCFNEVWLSCCLSNK